MVCPGLRGTPSVPWQVNVWELMSKSSFPRSCGSPSPGHGRTAAPMEMEWLEPLRTGCPFVTHQHITYVQQQRQELTALVDLVSSTATDQLVLHQSEHWRALCKKFYRWALLPDRLSVPAASGSNGISSKSR